MSTDHPPFTFDADQRRDILQTAFTIEALQKSAPAEERETLADIIERVGFAMSPGSMATSSLQNVERRFEKVKSWKHISGTLLHIDKETTSKRAVFIVKTEPNKWNHDTGQEIARSNSTEWDASARQLANIAMRHIGDRVILRVAVEETGNPTAPSARVVHDIVFRGPDETLFDQSGTFTPPQIRWDTLGNGRQFDTSKLMTFQR